MHLELPPDRRLVEVLGIVTNDDVDLLGRAPNRFGSTFPSEVVTCRTARASHVLRLHCKYGPLAGGGAVPHEGHGHRGGVAYETLVYRRVLTGSGLSHAAYRGAYTDHAGEWTVLVLEHLDDALRVSQAYEPLEALRAAARWLGSFHAAHAARRPAFLTTYDREYFLGWPSRALELAAAAGVRSEALTHAAAVFASAAELLFEEPTVIHGEYTPHNTLARDGEIFPVDWESAAVGAGEIDVAALTDRWGEDASALCAAEYRDARWGAGAPPSHAETLEAARLYWWFRWLGDPRAWGTRRRYLPYLEELERSHSTAA